MSKIHLFNTPLAGIMLGIIVFQGFLPALMIRLVLKNWIPLFDTQVMSASSDLLWHVRLSWQRVRTGRF